MSESVDLFSLLDNHYAEKDRKYVERQVAIDAKRKQKAQERIDNREVLRARVKELVSEILPLLHRGETKREISHEVLGKLSQALFEAQCYRDVVYQHLYLEGALMLAKRILQWRIPKLTVLGYFKAERARRTPGNFRLPAIARDIRNAFLYSLSRDIELTKQQRLSQLMLSVVLNSGLLHTRTFLDFSKMGFRDVWAWDGLVWVDINISEETSYSHDGRRLVLDNISAQLIARFRYHANAMRRRWSAWGTVLTPTRSSLWMWIRDFLVDNGMEKTRVPSSIPKLLECVAAELIDYLPPYVLDYATGRNTAFSLSPHCHARLLVRWLPEQCHSDKELSVEKSPAVAHQASAVIRSKVSAQESGLIRRLARCLGKGNREEVQELLEAESEHVSPVLSHVTHWALALSEGSVPGRRKNKGASVQAAFSRVSLVLVALARGRDIVELDLDEITALYESVLDIERPVTAQVKVGHELASFHKYLVTHYAGIEPVEFVELDGFIASKLVVRANILMPWEYEAVKEHYWSSEKEISRGEAMRGLAVILGYRLGLRRREILQLRLCDILGVGLLNLKIRSHESGRLKTSNAERDFPLDELLSGDELHFLRQWIGQRKEESRELDALLFAMEDAPIDVLSSGSFFDPIRDVLREVTGDGHFAFHLLRHSFVTWQIYRFEYERNVFNRALLGKTELHIHNTLHDHILLNGETTIRRLLRQVSMQAGHAHPGTTLMHYAHLLDHILSHYHQTLLPELPIKAIGYLIGYGRSRMAELSRNLTKCTRDTHVLSDWIPHQRSTMALTRWTRSPVDLFN